MAILGWILGILVILVMLAIIFACGYFFFYVCKTCFGAMRRGQSPFPGVTPWQGFLVWRLTGREGRHHDHHGGF
jgi:hypothetical protein